MWELDDPFGFDMTRFQLRTYWALSNPLLTTVRLPDEDLDRLPGPLPRLMREMYTAKSQVELREKAENCLVVTEEYLDR